MANVLNIAPFNKLREFLRLEAASGIILVVAAALAMALANSPLGAHYDAFFDIPVIMQVGDLSIAKPLLLWINDGLMAIFFLLVGLEIKREIREGELAARDQALLPCIAALGGMIVPAVIYAALNWGDAQQMRGWAIPTATDIAFALGVLAILGSRIPPGLKVLLTALAIVDDIGAVLVIAIFYTDQIATGLLLLGLGGFAVSIALNLLGVRSWLAYLVVGVGVWLAFLQSGVHATIAALLMAFTIPARTRIDGDRLMFRLDRAVARLREVGPPRTLGLNSPAQEGALDVLQEIHDSATAPLQRLEHAIAGLVTFVVLPIFALANAGVSLVGAGPATLGQGIALGVAAGLVLGKPVGIFGFSWLAVRAGLCRLPKGVVWSHVAGIGLLGGVGFTMALFIADLAFARAEDLAAAKMGILVASTIAATAGLLVLRRAPTAGATQEAAPGG